MMKLLWNRARARHEGDDGFTLVELLVVVVIIGILVAIAIPVFLSQREKAWTAEAQSDLRNAAPVAESFFATNGTYAGLTPTGMLTSPDDTITAVPAKQTLTAYCLDLKSTKLTPGTFYLSSTTGIVKAGSCP